PREINLRQERLAPDGVAFNDRSFVGSEFSRLVQQVARNFCLANIVKKGTHAEPNDIAFRDANCQSKLASIVSDTLTVAAGIQILCFDRLPPRCNYSQKIVPNIVEVPVNFTLFLDSVQSLEYGVSVV